MRKEVMKKMKEIRKLDMQFRAENSDLISKGTFNILKTDRRLLHLINQSTRDTKNILAFCHYL